MTNFNPNPHCYVNTTGWTTSAGALSANASPEGLKIVGTAPTVTAPPGRKPGTNFDYVDNDPYTLGLVQLRRNTTSGQPQRLRTAQRQMGAGIGGWQYTSIDLSKVVFPVGVWVTIPFLGFAGVSGQAMTEIYALIEFAGAVNFNTKGWGYLDNPGDYPNVDLDASDAGFTATIPNNSLTVPFSHDNPNEMIDALRWSWGHGGQTTDGPANTNRTPSHTFPTAGTYQVALRASNRNLADSFTVTKTITVPAGTYQASFVWENAYRTLNVDGRASTGAVIDTYTWDWGDGTPAGTGALSSHEYAQGGTYDVKLTISNALGQSNSITKQITVTDPPSPNLTFTVRRELLAVDYFPSLTGKPSYAWSFGDGQVSNVETPHHVYATPGTYDVTLTTAGYTVTRSIVVYAAHRPLRNIADALRLEVELPPVEGAQYNRIPNPSGRLGSFGWATPVADSAVFSSQTADQLDDKGFDGWKLGYRSSGVGAQIFYSAPVQATPGRYVAAAWTALYTDGYYRVALEALNAAGAVLGSSADTGYLTAPGNPHRSVVWQLPAATATVRLRVKFTSDTGAGIPALGKIMLWRRTMLAMAPASATLAALVYTDDANWTDLLGPATTIDVQREPLDLSSLTAIIRDATLDPANASTLRPGQGVRLRVQAEDAYGQVTYEPIYTGRLSSADVTYDRDKTRTARTVIHLSAVDVVTEAANVGEARGVGSIAGLPELLEGTAVPFLVNGSGGQTTAAQIVAYNDDATLLDQVAIARDTDSGYAHVSRDGVLVINDPVAVPAGVIGVLDDKTYSDVDATFAFDECINSVTIKWLRFDNTTGQTTEVLYGPYEDLDSVEEFGRHAETFTMQGAIENEAAIAARGAEILAANATPARRVNSVTIPIRYADDLVHGKALLDLYDLVQVKHPDTGTDQLLRITELTHKITPKRWTIKAGFNADGTVARPAATPTPVTYAAVAGLSTEIPSGANLNTYVKPGSYAQSSNVEAAAGTNYPVPQSGWLEVAANLDQTMIWQRYTVYNGSPNAVQTFVRGFFGAWSSWRAIGVHAGWTALPLAAGWAAYGGGFQTPQYKVEGTRVRLRGLVRDSTAAVRTAAATIATLAALAPPANLLFPVVVNENLVSGGVSAANTGAASTGTAHTHPIPHTHTSSTVYGGRLDVSTAGVISIALSATAQLPASGIVSLDGVAWDLD